MALSRLPGDRKSLRLSHRKHPDQPTRTAILRMWLRDHLDSGEGNLCLQGWWPRCGTSDHKVGLYGVGVPPAREEAVQLAHGSGLFATSRTNGTQHGQCHVTCEAKTGSFSLCHSEGYLWTRGRAAGGREVWGSGDTESCQPLVTYWRLSWPAAAPWCW